jgi:cysteine-rich repeat protein
MLRLAVLVLSFAALAPWSAANAAVTCPTSVTQAGTSANEDLVGTSGNDRIAGNGGKDVIHGGDGSDCLIGGSFEDRLFGEDGDDELIGEGGEDFLDGGPGDDVLNGGSDADVLVGGPGTDAISGEGGDDVIVIHAGDVPAGESETIDGGSGNDTALFDFDPGAFTPPNFTVTDPVTGGRYRFFSVEKVARNVCGDGVRQANEACDDGNTTSGDGCDANCTPTGCGNGIVTAGEECDDANRIAGDGCSPDCRRECGDGVLEPGEECDDGNTVGGDGCSATCRGECTASTVCDDGDPCTVDSCRGGVCVADALEPFASAICRTDVLARLPECASDVLPAKLALPGRTTKIETLLRRASNVSNRRNLLVQAGRVAGLVRTKAGRLTARHRLSPACGTSLDQHAAELAALIAALR